MYNRNLPHWRQEGATYFVTFRLADSLPQEKLEFLRRLRQEWERQHPLPRSEGQWEEFAKKYIRKVEAWLDEGHGECLLKDRELVATLRDRLHHFQDDQYFLSCWSIMPNHCHMVIRPNEGQCLEELLGSMKSVSAHKINKSLNRKGTVWQQESYDRIVRDESHLWRIVQYIGRNPRKANLEHENDWRRWIHPAWIEAGWQFFDS